MNIFLLKDTNNFMKANDKFKNFKNFLFACVDFNFMQNRNEISLNPSKKKFMGLVL